MSATLEQPTRTVQQRTTAATNALQEIAGVHDLKILSAAVAEIVAAEARANPAFAELLRRTCQEIAASSTTKPAKQRLKEPVRLIPVTTLDISEVNWTGELDPYRLYKLFGAAQFRTALEQYTLVTLKDGVEKVIARHPGTKPKTRSKKDDIIDYIVLHVPQDS